MISFIGCRFFLLLLFCLGNAEPASKQDEEEFMEWLKVNGVDTSGFKIGHFRIGRGIEATRHYAAGATLDSLLFTVPPELLLNSQKALESNIGELLKGFMIEASVDPSAILAIYVVHELLKGKQSFWSPYFGVMPVTTDIPMFWKYFLIKF